MITSKNNYNTINENLSIDQERKESYGEINTPYLFIEEMYDSLPQHLFTDPTLRWLDAGAGSGNFSIVLYYRLMKGLGASIEDSQLRSKHIIKNMILYIKLKKVITYI